MLNQVNLRLNATERISYHQVTPGSIFLKGGREGVKTKGSRERSGADRKFPLLDAYPALYTTFLAENTQIVFILRLMNQLERDKKHAKQLNKISNETSQNLEKSIENHRDLAKL